MDFLIGLKDTPVPGLLAIFGGIGLLMFFANGLPWWQIRFEKIWERLTASGLGAFLLILGILLYVQQPAFLFPHIVSTSTPTSTVTSTSTPVGTSPSSPSISPTTACPSFPSYIAGCGTLAMSDPLVDNSHGYSWDTESRSSGPNPGSCMLTANGYRFTATNYFSCQEYGVNNLANFVFEAQMTLQSGSAGGFILRNIGDQGYGYHIHLGPSGSYSMNKSPNNVTLRTSTVNPLMPKGETSYLVDLEALGSQLTLYVDRVKIDSVTDSSYSQGRIGFYVTGDCSSCADTEVTFTNLKVWSI